jgi:hypothetical protein
MKSKIFKFTEFIKSVNERNLINKSTSKEKREKIIIIPDWGTY